MIKKIRTWAIAGFIVLSNISFATEVETTFNATSKINKFCSIKSENINFGIVSSPLTTQSANAQMRVLCTNNTPYKVDLIYGKYIAGGSPIPGYTISYEYANHYATMYKVYKNSVYLGGLYCGYGTYYGKIYATNINVANLYGYSTDAWNIDSKKTCVSDNTLAGTKPTGWIGAYNASGQQQVGAGPAEFGYMSGVQKANKLAYKITLPNDSTKTWTKDLNSYNAKGIGAEQTINVNAQIVPDKSTSKYVAADIYLDNIIAEIIY